MSDSLSGAEVLVLSAVGLDELREKYEYDLDAGDSDVLASIARTLRQAARAFRDIDMMVDFDTNERLWRDYHLAEARDRFANDVKGTK
jgi:hypothetical protein